MRYCTHMLRRLLAVSGLLATVVLAVVLGDAGPAAAHPLGNLTVNRYARVEVSSSVLRVYYVLDEAEIPTFEDRDAIAAGRDQFVRSRTEAIRRGLHVQVNNKTVTLTATATLFTLPEGQGGLPTSRLAIRFEGGLGTTSREALHASFADLNEPDRIGWREIVVEARGDAHIDSSNAPATDVSDELRHYPADATQAPLDLRRATFTFRPGTTEAAPAPLTSPAAAPKRSGSSFSNLITKKVTPFALLGMVGLALVFGAGHALAPGHGKTVMAAYLIGTRGRPIDAVLLGVIVSAMHTASVLILAVVLYQVNRSTPVDRIFPWLTIASGALVSSLGIYLIVTRARAMQHRRSVLAASSHEHALGHTHTHPLVVPNFVSVPGHEPTQLDRSELQREHAHTHEHDHHHGPGGHTHELPPDVAPLSRRGLILLATSGGLLPSPSAVLVLIAAFAAGRAALGLLLVGVFSIGLAVTLTGVGLALVIGGRALERRGKHRGGRFAQWLPVGSAAAITIVGSVIAGQGISRL